MIFDLLLKTSVLREYTPIPTIKHVMMSVSYTPISSNAGVSTPYGISKITRRGSTVLRKRSMSF